MTETIIIGGLVWGVVICSIYRGYRRSQQVTRDNLLIWLFFVMLALIFTFRIPAVQPFIDARFGEYPVTFELSLLAVLAATALYSLFLKWLAIRSPAISYPRRVHQPLINAAPVIAGLDGLLFAFHVCGWLSSFQLEYTTKWLLELYGLLQSVLVTVPINWHLVRHEQVFAMRIKHGAALVFLTTFAVSAAVCVVSIPPIIITGKVNNGPYLIPRGLITALCLVVILVPHPWLKQLQLPRHWSRYRRLVKAESQLEQLVTIRREPVSWPQLFRLSRLELAIYVTAINILDHYRGVDLDDPRGRAFYEQVQAALPPGNDYEALVEALCNVMR